MRPGWAPEESWRAASLPTSSSRGARTPAGSMLLLRVEGDAHHQDAAGELKKRGGGSGGVVSGRVGKERSGAQKTEFRISGFPSQGEGGGGQFPGESRDGA